MTTQSHPEIPSKNVSENVHETNHYTKLQL